MKGSFWFLFCLLLSLVFGFCVGLVRSVEAEPIDFLPHEACHGGFLFIESGSPGTYGYRLVQVLDESGGGIPCGVEN